MRRVIRKNILWIAAICLAGIAAAQTTAPPGSAEKTAPIIPNLPDISELPAVEPEVGRVIRDVILPGLEGGAPPVKPSVQRSTGDEDEMDDLDVQRRTAPTDQGVIPLPNPAVLLPETNSTSAPSLINRAVAVGSQVARSTGDEDEMDDLDVQRRTAPNDLGGATLPHLNAPLVKGRASAISVPSAAVGPSIRTLKPVYRSDQQVRVEYSGMPGNDRDWITIVPLGTPTDKYGAWVYLEGEVAGTYKFTRHYAPGVYEVRAYKDQPDGDDEPIAVATFEVR